MAFYGHEQYGGRDLSALSHIATAAPPILRGTGIWQLVIRKWHKVFSVGSLRQIIDALTGKRSDAQPDSNERATAHSGSPADAPVSKPGPAGEYPAASLSEDHFTESISAGSSDIPLSDDTAPDTSTT